MIWGAIEYHTGSHLIQIPLILNSQRYISEVVGHKVLLLLQCIPRDGFHQEIAVTAHMLL